MGSAPYAQLEYSGLKRPQDQSITVSSEVGLPEVREIALNISQFHDELRRRNLAILFWTNMLFNPALVLWSVLDYFLVPDIWFTFLILRIAGAAVNFLVLLAIYRLGLSRYSWEGMWSLIFVLCAVVSLMLPYSGESFTRYVMGFSVIIFGAGVIPVWPPRWGFSVLVASVGLGLVVIHLSGTHDIPAGDLLGNTFVVTTAVGLSIAATYFKYDLVKRDYLSRVQLSAVAQKESDARLSLARTSSDLQSALEQLKELDRLKSKFFANVSHELRTPLTLILAPLDELTEAVEDPAEKQQLRVIRRNAERLLGLINDLLDLSRLDAGGLRLNLAEMDVRTVAATVHENSLPAAMAKSIDFALVADATGNKIWGDAHRLEIVLTNLVSNAIKFTPAGGHIDLRVRDLEEGVMVEVEDAGPGIPAEDLPRVFERFFQVNPGDRRREGGVGIGLALAKELVELHGGTIGVESESGVFTRFTIVLPFGRDHIRPEVVERRQQFDQDSAQGRRAEDRVGSEAGGGVVALESVSESIPASEPPVLFEGFRRARILLVEDHEEVRDFIKTLLEPQYELMLAENGREALELVRAESPDLVVSDVMMPEMSGTELARAIKSDPAQRATPVILLTARVGSEATLEAYAHGADDFVAKPFHPRVLMARIRAQLRLRALGLQLAQQEKLAAVGTLAAGILHEVRNPVNAILNAARVLSEGKSKPELARQLIQVIADGAQRIEGITAALDSHARPAEAGVTHSCDVREGFDATLTLLSHRLDGITVHREYATDRPAEAPAGPLNQVLLNLIDNAIRAGADTIWLRVEEDGTFLRVSVGDDGPGVATEDVERIFNPFFTKRKDGSGTGLGLYLSRQIAEELGGALRLVKRPGAGAWFELEVPALVRGGT